MAPPPGHKSGSSSVRRHAPWVEKHRPRDIGEVAHQAAVTAALTSAVSGSAGAASMPHLLFYGPPGTGKTTCALALCRELFGTAAWHSRVLELNASDERGISVVRNQVKNFASQAVGTAETHAGAPPFKVIILDECDAMTEDAQHALRRTMELFSKSTRFVLCCNYISRVIDPLASRCAKFRFEPLPVEAMTRRLEDIARLEGVHTPIAPEALEALSIVAQGDMRRAITTMQSASMVCAAKQQGVDGARKRRREDGGGDDDAMEEDVVPPIILDREVIMEVAGRVEDTTVAQLVRLCAAGGEAAKDAPSSSLARFDAVQTFANMYVSSGQPMPQLVSQFVDALISSDTNAPSASNMSEIGDVLAAIDDPTKAKWLGHCSVADAGLVTGGDELLSLLSLVASCREDSPKGLRTLVADAAAAAPTAAAS